MSSKRGNSTSIECNIKNPGLLRIKLTRRTEGSPAPRPYRWVALYGLPFHSAVQGLHHHLCANIHTHSTTTTIKRRACPRAKDTAAKASKASNPLLCNWSNAKPVNYLFPSPIGRRTTAAPHRRGPGLVQIFPSFCALFVCVF